MNWWKKAFTMTFTRGSGGSGGGLTLRRRNESQIYEFLAFLWNYVFKGAFVSLFYYLEKLSSQAAEQPAIARKDRSWFSLAFCFLFHFFLFRFLECYFGFLPSPWMLKLVEICWICWIFIYYYYYYNWPDCWQRASARWWFLISFVSIWIVVALLQVFVLLRFLNQIENWKWAKIHFW